MSDFTRQPKGFRFAFRGMKTNVLPDACPPGKYPIAVNVRGYTDTEIQSRPGLTQLFTAGGTNLWFTDVRAYTQLETDNNPRLLARNADDTIWLDIGTKVGTLAAGGFNASLIPFRPAESPQPWMYIANGADYQKFSAPSATNAVTQQKVGIAEPQTSPDAFLGQPLIFSVGGGNAYVNAGTAGASTASTRVSDTVGAGVFNPRSDRVNWTFQVGASAQYQRLQYIEVAGNNCLVEDVFPGLANAIAMQSIFYFVGTTGRCVLVLNTLGGPEEAAESSIYAPTFFASLRRNAIIKIGTELCQILSVVSGPDGTVAVETSTTTTHTTADFVTLVPAVQVMATNPAGIIISPAQAITDFFPPRAYAVTVGIGTQTTPIPVGFLPFSNNTGSPNLVCSQDDYLSFGFKVDNLANLVEMKLLIDVSDGTFTKDFYYFTIRAADLAAAIANAVTQLAAAQTVAQRAIIDEENAIESGNQGATVSGAQSAVGNNAWTQVAFTLGEMTRVGNDQTKSLMTATAFQILWNASGTINVVQDSQFPIWGGSWPDTGDVGSPFRYRVRPRSKATGVIGNPSPETRYGVTARRHPVLLTLPSAAYDPQIDTWDIFRYGGSVTSWRFVGSTPSTSLTFQDIFSDSAVEEGDELDLDNFEPWPVVDVPNNGTASIVSGTVAIISTTDTDTASYLPGTLVQLGGQNVYTLRSRPVNTSGNNYRLEFIENAGAATNLAYGIQEPLIANAKLPFMWGPDVSGTVFAVGDPLNPGKLYFTKNYAPDNAPDKFNIEITPPSEPLLGGEVVDGLGFVASPERWWALYPQPDNPTQRYNFVQQPVQRGLAAPSGHCTDGKEIFFWAKDGIWGTASGSLTDEDLYNLFPHEGVPSSNVVYNGVTVQAPNYGQAPAFRLTYSNGFLYAVYQDINDQYRMLVMNMRTRAWCVDQYATQISDVYHVEQPAESQSARNAPTIFAGRAPGGAGTQGAIFRQDEEQNDGLVPITCQLAVNEFDGGDSRAPKQWGDFFLDLLPAAVAGVSATPMSLGAGIVAATVIPSGASRVRLPISVGGTLVSDFMGLFLTWTDDFTQQSLPTTLHLWDPSFDIQPAYTISWKTFGTSFGARGFLHIQAIALAWVSTQPITLTIVTGDGQDPLPLVIPSSGGVYQKALFNLTANKGQIYNFQASSSAKFQVFEDDIEIRVGQWDRQGPYEIFKSFGGETRASSPV